MSFHEEILGISVGTERKSGVRWEVEGLQTYNYDFTSKQKTGSIKVDEQLCQFQNMYIYELCNNTPKCQLVSEITGIKRLKKTNNLN